MKICIVSVNVYSLFNPNSKAPMGGAELDMYTTAIGLKEKFDVSVITGDWGQKNIEKNEGIKIYKSFSINKNIFNYIVAPFKLISTLSSVNADIYITSGAGIEVGIIALYCKYKKKKYIYRTASVIDCNGDYIKFNKFKGYFYEYGLLNANQIITSVKQHSQILLTKYPKLNNNIKHINLGIVPKINTSNKNNILWVGRCEKMKNPEIFLKIAKKLKNINFVMICPIQNHNKSLFNKIKNKSKTTSNIKFIDFVPFKDIQQYFNEAKIFINTSDFEGFTYTLIQSGLAHTPVVYLNVNPDEVITNYNLGYVSGGNVSTMIKQINSLLINQKDWNNKSKNIYNYVRNNHDINKTSKEWNKTLYSLQ